MKFSILTCSFNNLDGVKEAVAEIRRQCGEDGGRRSDIGDRRSGVGGRTLAVGSWGREMRSSADPVEDVIYFTVEHIIIDGGSTDGTVAWLGQECERRTSNTEHSTSRYALRWISEPDEGLYDALNKGLKMATGDVIGILHTDDVWEPEVLRRVAEVFGCEASLECESAAKDERTFRFGGDEAELRGGKTDRTDAVAQSPEGGSSVRSSFRFRTPGTSVDAVYGDLLYVDAEDITQIRRVWKSGSYDQKKWFNGWMPPHPALFVSRELAERVGDYRLDLGSAADYEWMLRAGLIHHTTFTHVPEIFVRMRVGGQSNANLKSRLKAHEADQKAWEVNALKPKFWTLKMKVIRKIPQWVAAKLRMHAGRAK